MHPVLPQFLLDLPAPLSAEARAYVQETLTRGLDLYGDRLDEDDFTTLARLTDPDDAAGITRRPDTFVLSAQTVTRPARSSPRPGGHRPGRTPGGGPRRRP